MIDLSFLKEYWWVGLIVLGIIILAIVLRKRKTKQDKPETTLDENPKHDWKPMGYTVVKDKLRLVFYDKENGVAIHAPIYTMKQLKELEND